MNKKWHLLCCKPNCEKKLASQLNKRKIEHYSPLNRIEKIERNKKRISPESLFPLYVFVYIPDSEIAAVKEIDVVSNFVYWLGSPVIVKDDDIELIRCLTNQYFNIELQKINVENKSAVVEIIGYFNHQNTPANTGIQNKTVYKLLLPALGYLLLGEKEKASNSLLNYGKKSAELFS